MEMEVKATERISVEMRKVPWSSDEDSKLIHYIALHGQGRWDSLAHFAENLPGRSDNDVKNYWRTKVQKHAKELHCDVNGQLFQDFLLYQWLPSLAEQIHATATSSSQEHDDNMWNTEVNLNTPNFVQTGINGSTNITCPNVVSSTNSFEAEVMTVALIDDSDIWTSLSSFEDGIISDFSSPDLAVYEDQYYCHNYWASATSEIFPDETLCLDDMDLWLFP
ncbi:hypothetical protein K7X08_034025 [Anisodus acutangulus]|uniref:Uncharacterized protein n=1 Tax=Anisodus acutangulus TaxID=402998 RepID=A0A9Q1RJH2_9SOLA|nr:hypothetical protein K7X08_034025 [Anisodus acutangulus]